MSDDETAGVPLALCGASGHARVVIDAVRRAGQHRIVGLLDPNLSPGTTIDEVPVIGTDRALAQLSTVNPGLAVIIAIGDIETRVRIAGQLADVRDRIEFATVVHPAAVIAGTAVVGPGAFIAASAILNAGARIGAHTIINTGATVDHETVIGDFSFVGPNAALAGNTSVGRRVFIGIGACVAPGVVIGDGATIGAGAVVIRDVVAGATMFGNPAR